VTRNIAQFSALARRHPLHPVMPIVGVLLAAVTAKLGHAMWGTGGMLAFYPVYLAMLGIGRNAAALVRRISVSEWPAQEHAYARIRGRN